MEVQQYIPEVKLQKDKNNPTIQPLFIVLLDQYSLRLKTLPLSLTNSLLNNPEVSGFLSNALMTIRYSHCLFLSFCFCPRMTGREFFTRFPALYPFLLNQLEEAASTVERWGGSP